MLNQVSLFHICFVGNVTQKRVSTAHTGDNPQTSEPATFLHILFKRRIYSYHFKYCYQHLIFLTTNNSVSITRII